MRILYVLISEFNRVPCLLNHIIDDVNYDNVNPIKFRDKKYKALVIQFKYLDNDV